ncbi:EAL domain-containing protein [Blastococcus sp. HT6-30]|uniref:EAL domain-containing protein n=1 Tax=Blastococcus sp. HT6-30 TaxID=3144843 RepID=UPI0032197585
MADAARSQQVMAGLRRLGVRLSVDDYGTGYSSLSYLRALPVDELKLDRSFVTHLSSDPRAAAIVRSTLQLSRDLGMSMVVEGVEDADSLAALREWGCDVAQGYHISRPMPAERLLGWLDAAADAGRGEPGPALPPLSGGCRGSPGGDSPSTTGTATGGLRRRRHDRAGRGAERLAGGEGAGQHTGQQEHHVHDAERAAGAHQQVALRAAHHRADHDHQPGDGG